MHLLPTRDFDQLLTAGATWLLVGCAGWAALICVAAVIEALTAGRLRATTWVGCPAPLRRAVLAGLGLALVGVPGPATSAASRAGDGRSGLAAPRQHGLPAPARPVGTTPARTQVVVRPGDSLWHLAQQRLRSPSPAAIARLVARTHVRNLDVIGPDPDLIRPGQRLTLPVTAGHHDPFRAESTPRGEP